MHPRVVINMSRETISMYLDIGTLPAMFSEQWRAKPLRSRYWTSYNVVSKLNCGIGIRVISRSLCLRPLCRITYPRDIFRIVMFESLSQGLWPQNMNHSYDSEVGKNKFLYDFFGINMQKLA